MNWDPEYITIGEEASAADTPDWIILDRAQVYCGNDSAMVG